MDSAPPCPATAPPWVILNRFPRRDLVVTKDAGISLEYDAAPGITQLAVPPSILADSGVVAADPSGIFLLSGSCGSATDPLATGQHPSAPFLVWDAVYKSTFRLPVPEMHMDDIGAAGLIVADDGFGRLKMMAAALVVSSTVDCASAAVLRCFPIPATETDKWIPKILHPPPTKFPWRTTSVHSYKGRLWWVDPLQGLLACDPFADKPELHFVRLPSCFSLARGDEQNLRKGLSKDRCVNVSCGMLRLAAVTRRTSSPKIKLWTLVDPEAGKWILNDEVHLKKICGDQSYMISRLPRIRPEVALIHPTKPHVVYLFVQGFLFSLDLQMRMVTETSHRQYDTNNLLAWELPPSLRATSSGLPTNNLLTWELPPSLRATSSGIAGSFCSVYARHLANMEFQQFMKLALRTLNKKTTNKENQYKLPEPHHLSYFEEPDKQKKYAHINFYAHNGSGKVLIFAELQTQSVGDDDPYNWTVSSCKILNKNCHGGLYCDVPDLIQSKTKKRKRSLYCFVCEPQVLHPVSGFEGGYGGGCQ